MKKKLFICFIAAIFSIVAVAGEKISVRVAAAANLRDVLGEIEKRYESENSGVDLLITFSSSGKLTAQIINGAGFQFFMSANKKYPMKLREMGKTTGDVFTYAYGRLAIWSKTIDITGVGLNIVTDKKVKRISVANPKTAPYGDRSIETLTKAGFLSKVKEKIVYADNISGAAHYAFTGNAEVGFIAYSQYRSPAMLGKGYVYLIPSDKYTPIEQACTLVKQSTYNVEAKKFMDYILSDKCDDLWDKYGYSK